MTDFAERHACLCHHAGPAGFALPGAEKHYPPDLELESLHLDIALTLDLREQVARGEVTHTVRALRAGAPALTLHAVSFEAVRVHDADGRPLSFSYDGAALGVRWERPFAAGEERRVVVAYEVRQPVTGLHFSKPLPKHPNEPWYAATDNETERARYWLPCIDLPSARPRLDLHLRAEKRFTILANGALVDETAHPDGTKTAHWRLDAPCPSYLTCFAVGDFVRADDGEHVGTDGARVPVAYFATREFNAAHLHRTFGRTRPMLDWMTRKLDYPFPYPKYFQFALPRFGGAMENISLVSWDDRFLLDEALAGEWSRLVDQINSHEMGHSYFGDLVVIRDFAHAWLKESWATYLEQCWFEDNVSADEADYEYYMNAQAYFGEADGRYRRPIVLREYSSSFDLYDRHLYPGGACRLHTLGHELGDGAFWDGVRLYLRRYAGKVVETDDFRRALEQVSGRSLGRFFDQWFHTPGYPVLKVSFAFNAERHEGTFEVEQTQMDAAAGVPRFEFPLELSFTIDGVVHHSRVELSREKQVVVLAMAKDPEAVRVDPAGKVLHKLEFNPGDTRLRAQLTGAPDVVGRILAGRELCKTGKGANLLAVAKAYRAEKFWGVRVEWARALSEAGAETALQSLAELVALERSPLVLEALLRAAGGHRHEALREAVLARVRKKDLPPRALGAAYEALGAQRAEAPLALLKTAVKKEGFGGFAQYGAISGLSASRGDEAFAVCLAASVAGATSDRARGAAVVALGELGRLGTERQRQEASERCVELLRDPINRVREAAVYALERLGATQALGALAAYGRALPRQEEVRVERSMANLRQNAEPRGAAAEKRYEELHARLRKAEDALQKLEATVLKPARQKPAAGKLHTAAARPKTTGAAARTTKRRAPGRAK